MAYQVIARKYRPQRFSDVVGQEHVTRTLSQAIDQNRIAHAYLFCGPRGTGKTTWCRKRFRDAVWLDLRDEGTLAKFYGRPERLRQDAD